MKAKQSMIYIQFSCTYKEMTHIKSQYHEKSFGYQLQRGYTSQTIFTNKPWEALSHQLQYLIFNRHKKPFWQTQRKRSKENTCAQVKRIHFCSKLKSCRNYPYPVHPSKPYHILDLTYLHFANMPICFLKVISTTMTLNHLINDMRLNFACLLTWSTTSSGQKTMLLLYSQ